MTKTTTKLLALGVVSLGFSIGLLGCTDDNDKKAMTNPEGGKAPAGRIAPGAPTSSAEAGKTGPGNGVDPKAYQGGTAK